MAINFNSSQSEFLEGVETITPPDIGSVCMWVNTNLDAYGNHQRIMGCADNFEIRIRNNDGTNRLYNDCFVLGGGGNLSSTFAIIANTWYHFVCTWNLTTHHAEIYINGIFNNSWDQADDDVSEGTVRIGHRYGATGNYFDGELDDIRVYGKVLTPSEIQTIYASRGADGIINDLHCQWIMNEGVGSASGVGLIKTITSGSMHMTPNNTPTFTDSIIEKYRRRY